MNDNSKYDFFMNELVSLEKVLYSYVQKNQETSDRNLILEKKIKNLEKENESYKLKLNDLETKLNNTAFNLSQIFDNDFKNTEDKESLKNKIDDLLKIIDYHLRS